MCCRRDFSVARKRGESNATANFNGASNCKATVNGASNCNATTNFNGANNCNGASKRSTLGVRAWTLVSLNAQQNSGGLVEHANQAY